MLTPATSPHEFSTDRIAALIDSSRALTGALALALASIARGELSASEIDALAACRTWA